MGIYDEQEEGVNLLIEIFHFFIFSRVDFQLNCYTCWACYLRLNIGRGEKRYSGSLFAFYGSLWLLHEIILWDFFDFCCV